MARQVYAAPLKGGSRVVVLFDRHTTFNADKFGAHNITVSWTSIGLPPAEQVR